MSDSLNNLPVTTIVRLKPKTGFKKEALNWFHSISDEASQFNGHLGAELFETINDSTELQFAIIVHFDKYENLMVWEDSKQRKEQLELSRTFFDELKPKLRLAGLEYWFETKEINPPKWKMLIVTFVIIFTLLNTLTPLLGKLFMRIGWPALINSLLSIIIMVTLMTYLVMPFITRVLSGWLFKEENVLKSRTK